MKKSIFVVDAFVTDRPFSGNPAGVCVLPEWPSDQWMQQVSTEMKHSETAFVVEDGAAFHIRYFTPVTEIALCGHATLASAFILWEEGIVPQHEAIVFHARGGTLKVKKEKESIQMDFPTFSFQEMKNLDHAIVNALSVKPLSVFKSENDIIFELESEQEIKLYKPDFSLMQNLPYRMIILTARSENSDFDFVSRVFAPTAGIDEDPATGIAQCILGPLWAEKYAIQGLKAYQASSRGAEFCILVKGNRVQLLGQAKLILKGLLYV